MDGVDEQLKHRMRFSYGPCRRHCQRAEFRISDVHRIPLVIIKILKSRARTGTLNFNEDDRRR